MTGEAVCEVIASDRPGYAAGDIVLAPTGWRTHAAWSGPALRKLDPAQAPVTTGLGVLGMPGFTAYAGLNVIGRPQAGETVVVAAASGPVGSLVGQLAKMAGCRAVGIAGGADKCRYVLEDLKFDAAIDHRAPISPRSSQPPARRASTFISRMSAARSGRRCCRCSTPSRAFPSAG